MALCHPGGLVLAPAMLQVEHGILGFLVLVVGRRCVDESTTALLGAFAPEEHLRHLSVRHILHGVEILVVGGNLDAALPAGGTVEVAGAGVVKRAAVDGQVVIVEALVHRAGSGAYP